MSNPTPSDRLIITLPPQVIDRLEARGARADRTRGPCNYTRLLTRTLGLYESIIVRSDPRETRALPQPHYELIVDLLRDPQRFDAFHIHCLGEYLLDVPEFARRATELGLEPGAFARAVNALTFAEKLHLVDSAQIRHAPPPRPRPQ
jgi:hypothetical protein